MFHTHYTLRYNSQFPRVAAADAFTVEIPGMLFQVIVLEVQLPVTLYALMEGVEPVYILMLIYAYAIFAPYKFVGRSNFIKVLLV